MVVCIGQVALCRNIISKYLNRENASFSGFLDVLLTASARFKAVQEGQVYPREKQSL
jgi:hypothetical protein